MADGFDPEGLAQRQLDAHNARDLERFLSEQPLDVAAVYEVTPGGIRRVWFLSGR